MPVLTASDIQNSMASYLQPKITIGMSVRFYPYADANDSQHETIGFVTRIGRQSVSIYVPTMRSVRDGVKHISDPRLSGSQELREAGSWDFTEEFYAIEGLVEELCRMVFPDPSAERKSPEKSAAVKELWKLRAEATRFGAKNAKSMTKEELTAFLKSRDEAAVAAGATPGPRQASEDI